MKFRDSPAFDPRVRLSALPSDAIDPALDAAMPASVPLIPLATLNACECRSEMSVHSEESSERHVLSDLPAIDDWSLVPAPVPTVVAPKGKKWAFGRKRVVADVQLKSKTAASPNAHLNLTGSQSDDSDSLKPETVRVIHHRRSHSSTVVHHSPPSRLRKARTRRSTNLEFASPRAYDSDDGGQTSWGMELMSGSDEDDDRDASVSSLGSMSSSSESMSSPSADVGERDRFDFLLDPRFERERREYMDRQQKHKKGVSKVWSRSGGVQLTKDLVRQGLPLTHRRALWLRASRANELLQSVQNSGDAYAQWLERRSVTCGDEGPPHIERDVERAFKKHPILCSPAFLNKLERVITAYTFRNAAVGYCAAMSRIVAVVLLFCAEEEAFAMLIILIERILPPQYFSKNSTDLRVDALVLKKLTAERIPKLYAHCDMHGVSLEQVFQQWLLNLFVACMPMDTVLRIWDCLFCDEGNIALLRCALGLLKMYEAELLLISGTAELRRAISNVPLRCYDVEQLFEVSFKRLGKFRKDLINNMRAKQKPAVMLQLRRTMDRRRGRRQRAARYAAAVQGSRRHLEPIPERPSTSHNVGEEKSFLDDVLSFFGVSGGDNDSDYEESATTRQDDPAMASTLSEAPKAQPIVRVARRGFRHHPTLAQIGLANTLDDSLPGSYTTPGASASSKTNPTKTTTSTTGTTGVDGSEGDSSTERIDVADVAESAPIPVPASRVPLSKPSRASPTSFPKSPRRHKLRLHSEENMRNHPGLTRERSSPALLHRRRVKALQRKESQRGKSGTNSADDSLSQH